MTTILKVYAHDDDAFLFCSLPAPIPGCRGFAISRRITDTGTVSQDVLANRVGFADDPAPPPGQIAHTQPSTVGPSSGSPEPTTSGKPASPFPTGDSMIPEAGGVLTRSTERGCAWTPEHTHCTSPAGRFHPYFNRGFLISPFMSHFLVEKRLTPTQFKGGRHPGAG